MGPTGAGGGSWGAGGVSILEQEKLTTIPSLASSSLVGNREALTASSIEHADIFLKPLLQEDGCLCTVCRETPVPP